MTRKEFIVQYAMAHKEMPSPELLAQMESNLCFDDYEDSNTPEQEETLFKDWDDFLLSLYRGCRLVCIKPFEFGTITLPVGFVVKFNDHSFSFGEDFYIGRVALGIDVKVNGKEMTRLSRKVRSYKRTFARSFKRVDWETPLSVLNDTPEGPHTRCDGVVRCTHHYEVDTTTLINI